MFAKKKSIMREFTLVLLSSWLTACAHGQAGQSRVMNGVPADLGQFPYQAYISDDSIACGASVIHKRWLLTAAHCEPYFVHSAYAIVGTVDKTGVNGTRRGFEKFIAHRNFEIREDKILNDIALIRLDKELRFDETVQPIKLARDAKNDYAGVTATLSGWGLQWPWGEPPTNLQYAPLQVMSQKDCSRQWKTLIKNQICTPGAVFQGEKASACIGDSGGPLVYENKQIGVVSYGQGLNCGIFLPDVYVRVATHVPWIQRQLRLYEDKLPA